jgi:putative addiction module killer protein
VGGGVSELRIPHGPGHRVYFGRRDNTVVILLYGGNKKSQSRDIALAQAYWDDYLRRIK